MAEIADRLRQLLAALKLKGTEFSEQTGVPYSTLRTYLDGGRAPSAEFLVAVFRVFGVLPSWVLTGEGPQKLTGSIATEDSGVRIPLHQMRASAGNGYVNEPDSHYEQTGMTVSHEWLRQRRLNARTLVVIYVRGKSMDGVLSDGDRVVVDTADTAPRSGFVYVIRQGDELLVKYCQLMPGGLLRLTSANPNFPPYDVDLNKTQDVQIVGRVVASMHEW